MKGHKTNLKKLRTSQKQWYTPIISAFRRLRQEDHKFKASMDYIVIPCLKSFFPVKNHYLLKNKQEKTRTKKSKTNSLNSSSEEMDFQPSVSDSPL
jgi:hypothetical protein